MNFVTIRDSNFGSGLVSRFSARERRLIYLYPLLRPFGPVFGASLAARVDSGGVESAANDMISDAREVFHPTAANEHYGVLLEVMPFTPDVCRDLEAISQSNTSDLTERRIRLLRSRGVYARAYSPLLRVTLKSWRLILLSLRLATLPHELTLSLIHI